MQPEFQDEKPVNPFDPFSGANFKLKIRKVAGFWNYDTSDFESSSKLFEDEAKVEAVCQKAYPLKEFTATDNFKSYEELKTRLDIVLSGKTVVGNVAEDIQSETPVESKETPTTSQNDDDTMNYFEKLANQ